MRAARAAALHGRRVRLAPAPRSVRIARCRPSDTASRRSACSTRSAIDHAVECGLEIAARDIGNDHRGRVEDVGDQRAAWMAKEASRVSVHAAGEVPDADAQEGRRFHRERRVGHTVARSCSRPRRTSRPRPPRDRWRRSRRRYTQSTRVREMERARAGSRMGAGRRGPPSRPASCHAPARESTDRVPVCRSPSPCDR